MAFVLGALASSCAQKAAPDRLQAKLDALKDSDASPVRYFVTCYSVSTPPSRAVYKCPVCSRQTVYDQDRRKGEASSPAFLGEVIETVLNIEEFRKRERQWLTSLSGEYNLRFSLDESGFCRHCRPSGEPRLVLNVKRQDGRTVSNPVTSRDFFILEAFFNDRQTFEDAEAFGESALKGEAARIAELLGGSV